MSDQRDFDIIVVGGGIVGLGAAYQASKKGYKVLLVEKDSLSSKTSDNSLRIIHGGLRYLQKLQLIRTMESIRAQAELYKEYPELITPLPCLMPLSPSGLKSHYPVLLGSKFYNLLKFPFSRHLGSSRIVSRGTFAHLLPFLAQHAASGALEWYDAYLENPYALAVLHKNAIIEKGSSVQENSPVKEIQRLKKAFLVKTRNGEHTSRVVINCAGPWTEKINFVDIQIQRKNLWAKAFNIVIRKKYDFKHALGIASKQNRLFFITPRPDAIAIGTFYFAFTGDVEDYSVTDEELEQAKQEFTTACPELEFTDDDIKKIEVGLLPAKSFKAHEPILYDHEAIVDYEGFIDVLSMKYTTFRSLGKKLLIEAKETL